MMAQQGRLSSVTKMDVFLLLRIDDPIDMYTLHIHGTYFSMLDLRSGCWQVKMALENTAFATDCMNL